MLQFYTTYKNLHILVQICFKAFLGPFLVIEITYIHIIVQIVFGVFLSGYHTFTMFKAQPPLQFFSWEVLKYFLVFGSLCLLGPPMKKIAKVAEL